MSVSEAWTTPKRAREREDSPRGPIVSKDFESIFTTLLNNVTGPRYRATRCVYRACDGFCNKAVTHVSFSLTIETRVRRFKFKRFCGLHELNRVGLDSLFFSRP